MQDTAPKPSGDELTGKQSKVLALLVGGHTIEAAAKGGATNPATVHAWLKKPGFAQSYKDARRGVVNQATAQLQAACADAVSTLLTVAKDKYAPASSRVSAARAILEMSLKAVELEDLAERIEALESLQKSDQAESSNGSRWRQ
jgi:hypothetical protein